MQSAAAPAPSRRKGWSPEARARRCELARDTPRGRLPEILVAARHGREIALGLPDVVVLDLHADCLRRGSRRVDLTGRVLPRIVVWALRHLISEDLPRAEMIAAVWPDRPAPASSTVAHLIGQAKAALRPVGLEIVSLYGGTLRLVAIEGSEA
jgi:hypothetical protein